MHAVVVECKTHQDRVPAEATLESSHGGDRAAFPDRERLLAPFGGERGARLGERWIVEGKVRCRRTGEALELDLGVGRQTRAHEAMEGGANFLRVLCPHQ